MLRVIFTLPDLLGRPSEPDLKWRILKIVNIDDQKLRYVVGTSVEVSVNCHIERNDSQ